VSNDGATVFASAQVARVHGRWKKYEAILDHARIRSHSAKNRLVLFNRQRRHGVVQHVSRFRRTWNNRPNGNRKDIMQLLADMKPAFPAISRAAITWKAAPSPRASTGRKTIGDSSQLAGNT